MKTSPGPAIVFRRNIFCICFSSSAWTQVMAVFCRCFKKFQWFESFSTQPTIINHHTMAEILTFSRVLSLFLILTSLRHIRFWDIKCLKIDQLLRAHGNKLSQIWVMSYRKWMCISFLDFHCSCWGMIPFWIIITYRMLTLVKVDFESHIEWCRPYSRWQSCWQQLGWAESKQTPGLWLADYPAMSFFFVCWHSRKWWSPIRHRGHHRQLNK